MPLQDWLLCENRPNARQIALHPCISTSQAAFSFDYFRHPFSKPSNIIKEIDYSHKCFKYHLFLDPLQYMITITCPLLFFPYIQTSETASSGLWRETRRTVNKRCFFCTGATFASRCVPSSRELLDLLLLKRVNGGVKAESQP